jgi:hypothetical protein
MTFVPYALKEVQSADFITKFQKQHDGKFLWNEIEPHILDVIRKTFVAAVLTENGIKDNSSSRGLYGFDIPLVCCLSDFFFPNDLTQNKYYIGSQHDPVPIRSKLLSQLQQNPAV